MMKNPVMESPEIFGHLDYFATSSTSEGSY